jgi:proteasome lid subunit RPN8/RPN11
MNDIPLVVKSAIAGHARQCFPEEACGLVVNGQVIPCKNAHPSPLTDFAILAQDYARIEKKGIIEAIYHSHPSGPDQFSSADIKACKQSNIPWILFNAESGNFLQADPSGNAPYEGRPWVYGVFDCYAILRDFYKREFNVELDDFERGAEMEWERDEWRMFERNWAHQGFIEIDKPEKKGDFLLMQINAPSPNHAGVISEDGWSFYHHLIGRQSEKSVYGGYWAKMTTTVLRHRKLL